MVKEGKYMKIITFMKKYLPLPCLIMMLIGIASGILLLIARGNVSFAEWLTAGPSQIVRRALAATTSWLPISIAELLIILAVPLAVLLIIIAARLRGAAARIRMLSAILAAVSVFSSVYVFTLGVGYHREPLASRMGLSSEAPDREGLLATASILRAECEALADQIAFLESGMSEMDMDMTEISSLVVDAYSSLAADMPELHIEEFSSSAKPVLLSKLMTKLEILGVYSFFTGESNVNVHYPDYTIPFTVAHEFAHQRGISRENEANFIAFLVCIRSENAYVRYSGYMNMLEYVASALNRTDKEAGKAFYASLDARLIGEMRAYSNFYYENKSEILSAISDFANDNYLKAQGTEGIVSYGLVVRLAVSYYSNSKGE